MLPNTGCRALCVFLVVISATGVSAAQFPFNLPWDDSSANLTNLSSMNHMPAGALGLVTVGTDGHLYTGSERIRFLGVNFSNASCFPQHADAERIARRLARFGINAVRFHLMDAYWGGQGTDLTIFDLPSGGTRRLSESSLDKLDYFFAELKKNGIYSDLNLLTGRDFRSSDGLDPAIDSMEWKDQQTPAMFDPTMIELQKEFARQLLGHRNPYTGLTYAEDPALALVEICNEHGLLHGWHAGMIDRLPGAFSGQLQVRWNSFLKTRYANHAALFAAWGISTPPGSQMLVNPGFYNGMSSWNVEQHQGARVIASVASDGPGLIPALRLQVTQTSPVDWHIQVNQGGLNVSTGSVYTLRFRAKSQTPATIQVGVGQAHDPWQGLGFSRDVPLSSQWQQFEYVFVLSGSDTNARLNFGRMCTALNTFWFADLSLAPGGSMGVLPDENLDTQTIRVITKSEAANRNQVAQRDWVEFLWTLEERYWNEIRNYIKNDLGTNAPIIGTVVGNSTPNLMAQMDVIDSHAYWHHPSFEISWGSPWWIGNTSMIDDPSGGTISGLARKRVSGKPFIVSEYNHPAPMSFDAETFLILSAYGALQDWDGIFGYTYADSTRNWNADIQDGYFHLHRSPGKFMNFLIAANIFRRGDVRAAKRLMGVSMGREKELDLLPSAGSWRLVDGADVGMPAELSFESRIVLATEGVQLPAEALPPVYIHPPGPRYLSDTDELYWDFGTRTLRIDTPRTKSIVGYAVGKVFDLSGILFRPTSSLQNWAAISLTVTQGPDVSNARRMLLCAQGMSWNTGMTYLLYPSRAPAAFPPPSGVDVTLGSWGTAPVLSEGIGCEIVLPHAAARVKVYALDERGDRKAAVPVSAEAGKAAFIIGEAYQTLWYEIEIGRDTRPSPRGPGRPGPR